MSVDTTNQKVEVEFQRRKPLARLRQPRAGAGAGAATPAACPVRYYQMVISSARPVGLERHSRFSVQQTTWN